MHAVSLSLNFIETDQKAKVKIDPYDSHYNPVNRYQNFNKNNLSLLTALNS